MKVKHTAIAALALSAALMFTACGQSSAESSHTVPEKPIPAAGAAETVQTEPSGSAQVQSGQSTQNLAADSAETEDSIYAGAFSKRDLSGEYDAAEAGTITLSDGGSKSSANGVEISGDTVTVTAAGTYILTGALSNGSIVVNASKDDKVQLVLKGVSVTSSDSAAVYVEQADKVFVTLAEGTENTLANGGGFDKNGKADGAVYSRDDLTFNGSGSLTVSSPAGNGIVGKDDVVFTGGEYTVTAGDVGIKAKDSLSIAGGTFDITATDDGLHAKNGDDDTKGSIYIAGGSFTINAKDDAIHAQTTAQIDGGSFTISASEGIEATYVLINDGVISIQASDDGINAGRKSSALSPAIEIHGGDITIVMGAGDTDGVDSNGSLIITGGRIDVTGSSTFDVDGAITFSGGTVIANGQEVDEIPNQMFGGGFRGGFDANGGQNMPEGRFGQGGQYGPMPGGGHMHGPGGGFRGGMDDGQQSTGTTGTGVQGI